MKLKNKKVIITGGASGMGKATAEVFADAGATVIATDIDKKGLENVVKEKAKTNKGCHNKAYDLTA